MTELTNRCGAVVIGRNEGKRLETCLKSLTGQVACVVYVDSGSTDGSVELARSLRANVVELDMSRPFSMARGRNAGFAHLMNLQPEIQFVQFVDGDCEILGNWLDSAMAEFDRQPDVAIVSGRRRERYPDASIYNRLTDIEWDTPIGEAKAVLGDMIIRKSAFQQAGGFNETLIAAEDDELCIRVRAHGHRIVRLESEMSLHDVAISNFGQWWKRAVRAGYGFAHVGALHSGPPEFYFAKDRQRIWIWSLGIPLTVVALAYYYGAYATLFLVVYPISVVRLARRHARSGRPTKEGLYYGLFMMLAKFAGLVGMLRYYGDRMVNRQPKIIEYKTSNDS